MQSLKESKNLSLSGLNSLNVELSEESCKVGLYINIDYTKDIRIMKKL